MIYTEAVQQKTLSNLKTDDICWFLEERKGARPSMPNPLSIFVNFGAGGRNRTDMSLRTGDFESFSRLKIPLSLVPDDKGKAWICQEKMILDSWQELG